MNSPIEAAMRAVGPPLPLRRPNQPQDVGSPENPQFVPLGGIPNPVRYGVQRNEPPYVTGGGFGGGGGNAGVFENPSGRYQGRNLHRLDLVRRLQALPPTPQNAEILNMLMQQLTGAGWAEHIPQWQGPPLAPRQP